MRDLIVLSSLVTFGLGAAAGAYAQERSGLYMGGSLGEATNESGEFKDSDTALKVIAGYAINDYLRAELAYVDAGTQKDKIGLIELENESTGVIASAMLSLPIGERLALFGKLGYAFYDADVTARLGNLREQEGESGDDWAYGVGLELAVWAGLKLRAEYEGVDQSGGEFEIVSAGATYEF